MKHLKRAKQQIESGKSEELIASSLALHFKEVDRNKFYEDMKSEYDALFPAYRDMTIEEQTQYDDDNFDEFTVKPDEFEYPKVSIDYTEDENYVTFEEYKNETKVVSEEVEATYDEEGMELTPYISEVTELVRPFVAKENYDLEVSDYLENDNYYATKFRADRDKLLEQCDIDINKALDNGLDVTILRQYRQALRDATIDWVIPIRPI